MFAKIAIELQKTDYLVRKKRDLSGFENNTNKTSLPKKTLANFVERKDFP
jgi:hypothetical protein